MVEEDSDIGACALLVGIDTTAQAYGLSRNRVTASILNLHTESSPFLRMICNMIVTQARSFGLSVASRNFGISEEVIRVLCKEVGAPLPVKRPAPKPKPVLPPPPEPCENPLLQLRKKVKKMYDQKVKICTIAALYGIHNDLIHSWGEFHRSPNRDKLLQLRTDLQTKLAQGIAIPKAAKELQVSQTAAENALGLCEDLEPSIASTPDKRAEAVRQARLSSSLASIVRKFRIPRGCIRRWLKDDYSLCDGDSKYIKSEEWASAGRKRRCLEEFYLTNGDRVQAGRVSELSPEQVQTLISDFEGKLGRDSHHKQYPDLEFDVDEEPDVEEPTGEDMRL